MSTEVWVVLGITLTLLAALVMWVLGEQPDQDDR